MTKKLLRKGTLVEIIGADNSGPTSTMYKLIGKTGAITEYSSDGNCKVLGWWWNPLDFKKVTKKVEIKKRIFDIKNLVTGDSL